VVIVKLIQHAHRSWWFWKGL